MNDITLGQSTYKAVYFYSEKSGIYGNKTLLEWLVIVLPSFGTWAYFCGFVN